MQKINKFETEDLCFVSDLNLAIKILEQPFSIVSCPWYSSCNSTSRYVDPINGAVLDLKYCSINPIILIIFIILLIGFIIGGIILWMKYKKNILKTNNDDDENDFNPQINDSSKKFKFI